VRHILPLTMPQAHGVECRWKWSIKNSDFQPISHFRMTGGHTSLVEARVAIGFLSDCSPRRNPSETVSIAADHS